MNPESEVMRDNLNFYFEKNPKLKYDELVNLETKNFVKSFRDGVDAYEKEDFDSVIRYFELGILEYIDAWKTCRLSCEKPFDMGWFPDFMTSVANHFTYCVRCKRQCLIKLANLDGEFHHDIFPLMFHYLQFAYYKNNDIRKSAECIESYMTLYDSKQMISNKEYYQELDEFKKSGNEAWFTPRDNVREYFEIIKRENDLINSIEDRFKFEEDSKESKFLKRHYNNSKGVHREVNPSSLQSGPEPATGCPLPQEGKHSMGYRSRKATCPFILVVNSIKLVESLVISFYTLIKSAFFPIMGNVIYNPFHFRFFPSCIQGKLSRTFYVACITGMSISLSKVRS
ncbi:unnamed protein product [Lepeophtheirus salmonis]|uniref:(salmon louse) hypothetical protein n=1 Tax=Lepeophtheirus salmonis TaxID=72036 RepID=A0A7R8CHQ9_LEPSM|nr:unnamed protein product [Lepeophtheirus salmonis]CAF2825699.1 unnamed protein product [Lepeophtheirus salmonis]